MILGALALGVGGCRLHLDSVHDGDTPDPEKVTLLEPGNASLDRVLEVMGAPDGVAWLTSEDVLIYGDARVRSTRWVLQNPIVFFNRITPQGMIGEVLAVVAFTAGRTGRKGLIPSRPPPGRPLPQELPEMMAGFGGPLKLNGDLTGEEQVRFVFDRATGILVRIEVERGAPGTDVSSTAAGTFLIPTSPQRD